MTRQDAYDLLTLLKEAQAYIGCACGMSHRKPCGQCVLLPKIKELIERIEAKQEVKK